MIPWPQDIPGAITIVFFFAWLDCFKIAAEYSKLIEARKTGFVLCLFLLTLVVVALRVALAKVWY